MYDIAYNMILKSKPIVRDKDLPFFLVLPSSPRGRTPMSRSVHLRLKASTHPCKPPPQFYLYVLHRAVRRGKQTYQNEYSLYPAVFEPATFRTLRPLSHSG